MNIFQQGVGSKSDRRQLNGEEEEEEDEDDVNDIEAWEKAYADERSWESLQEDESGLLRPIDNLSLQHAQYRRRIRNLSSADTFSRIQKGLIRYLYVVVDLSKAAGETDFRPTRMAVMAKYVEAFIREFFDQNPLSQISLVTVKDGVAHSLTDLGGSPESHIKALMSNLGCSGDASLQNALDLVHGYLNQIPSYGHREVLILYAALSTCDPGDIMETIRDLQGVQNQVLSNWSFSGNVYLQTSLSRNWWVILCGLGREYAIASLIRMGFPQRAAEGVISICSCHKEAKVGGGYTCPRCKARICEVPAECRICGLTLVSSPHLARSYHHLFPITPFDEVSPSLNYKPDMTRGTCFGCQFSFPKHGNYQNKSSLSVACPKCKQVFCLECDIYIHESLHNCPGCESLRHSR